MKKIPPHNLDVLIIDDEKDICFLLSSVLKNNHIESMFVNSLKEAALVLEINDPEIIFLDNDLPDGLGINFISFIKRFHPSTIIIMITAHDTLTDKQQALKKGVDFFIGKPFSTETVNNVLKRISS